MRLIFCLGGNRCYMHLARRAGWWSGARLPSTVYDVHEPLEFADQFWRHFDGLKAGDKRYQRAYECYRRRLAAVRPRMASVLDWTESGRLDEVLTWAREIAPLVGRYVMIIPKVSGEVDRLPDQIGGKKVILGFSIPTPHGATPCLPYEFSGRRVHLLGGSVGAQLQWADVLVGAGALVMSADNNSLHKAAGYGTYFDGHRFINRGRHVVSTVEALRRSLLAVRFAWLAAGWTLESAPQLDKDINQ